MGFLRGYFDPSVSTLSGGIGSGDIGDGAVLSGNIASGQIGWAHLSSGAVRSGHVGDQAVNSGNIGSGSIGSVHIQDGTIITVDIASGAVSSGQLASGSIQGFFGPVRNIASGTVGSFDFGSGAVTAGTVGSGAVLSGNIASGSISTNHFASGASVDVAEWLQDDNFTAGEILSGATIAAAVAFTQSGTLQTAMASISGRMPAVGIIISNVASGSAATLYRNGRLFSPAFAFSGWMNQPLYVGRSGQVISSGPPTNSGDVQQILGVSVSQSGAFLQVGDPLENAIAGSGDIGSGAVTGQAGGGYFSVASGTITTNDIGSGAIVSGLIASGQIGTNHIASGRLTGFELGSGAIVSGRIASGQVGFGHLANASVQSGTLASGNVSTLHVASGGLLSGAIGSGQVSTTHFASGSVIDAAEWLQDDNFTAGEILSGATIATAVAFTQSGILQTAMASVSGRMPAVGIITANVASGATVTMYRGGRLFAAAFAFSGWMNQPLYVGRSGQVIASGPPTNSGDIQQILGVSISQSGAMLQFGDALEGAIAGSGDIGSGSVTGQAGGGYFSIASGTIGTNDIGSGAILSGHIASGQVGPNHFASGLYVPQVTTWFTTAELISGIKAVAIESGAGNTVVRAERGSGLRLPSIGIAISGAVSGTAIQVVHHGFVYSTASGMVASGFHGRLLYCGSGGLLVNKSGFMGGASSGDPFLSGDAVQKMGMAVSGGVFVMLGEIRSGFVTAAGQGQF